ncbi:MAG: NADH-quinone oxidoreductase subunit C [Bacteroidia bacterium]|nr:NADH-quinone oxidoreductase subunit C [Bacteroidia bacterium]
MTKEELKYKLGEISREAAFDETGEFLNVIIPSPELLPLIKPLRLNKEFYFDYLFCITCVDWKDYLSMVYHLTSTLHRHTCVVQATITDVHCPQIESVSGIWKTAELNENEIYDLFGVTFLNHPNLRRLFLGDQWKGYPLRKDYTDEHMILL